MKKLLIPLLVLVMLLVTAGVIYLLVFYQPKIEDNKGNNTDGDPNYVDGDEPDLEDTVDLSYTFVEEEWRYSGTVETPTPCEIVTADAVIMESFPEQVTLNITTESSDEICAQVVTKQPLTGQIKVSEEATIDTYLNGELVQYNANVK